MRGQARTPERGQGQRICALGMAALITSMELLGSFLAIPVHAATFSADETSRTSQVRSINLGTKGIASPATASDAWSGDYLYYGDYYQIASPTQADKEPVRWRVLSGGDGEDLFLMADQVLDQKLFMATKSQAVSWEKSQAKEWMNGEMFTELFDRSEREAVALSEGGGAPDSVVEAENLEYPIASGAQAKTRTYTNPDADAKLFLLSYEEATSPEYGFAASGWEEENPTRVLTATDYARSQGADLALDGRSAWWLRSTWNERPYDAASIDIDGWYGADMASEIAVNGLAPAFHLDEEKVLLTSLAQGGKPEGAFGEFLNVEHLQEENQEWKLTIKDERHEGFRLAAGKNLKETDYGYYQKAAPNEIISLNYRGAKAGDEEHPEAISAILISRDADEDVFLYSRLKAVEHHDDENGNVQFELPDDLIEGNFYRLLVFAEQYNADNETDFASDFEEIRLEIKQEREIAVENGVITAIASPSVASPSKASPSKASPSKATPATASQADKESEGTAYEDWLVNVLADEAPEDMRFDEWRTSPVNLDWLEGFSKNSSYGTFAMPDENVELTARYVNIASPSEATVSAKVLPDDWRVSVNWDDLDLLLEDREVLTEEELERLEKGWHYNVEFGMKRHDAGWAASPSEAFAQVTEDGEKIGFYFETSLEKEIESRDQKVHRTEALTDVVDDVTVMIPLPEEIRDMSGYRLYGYTADDLFVEEPYQYEFEWAEGAKARSLVFTAQTNAVYALVYVPGDASLRVSCADIVYGDLLEPTVENNPAGSVVSFWYKSRGASDSTAVETMPVNAGEYTLIAMSEETENFERLIGRVDFRIEQRELADYMVDTILTQRYTGGPVEPELTVSDISFYTGENLITQADYRVMFENNVAPGTATAVIEATAEGNYRGKLLTTFVIQRKRSSDGGGSSSSTTTPRTTRPANVDGTWQAQADGTWRFFKTLTGKWAASEWIWVNDRRYYFAENGQMYTGWLFQNGNWYYLEENAGGQQGAMHTGWFQDPNDHYWYYLDTKTGWMRTGWLWLEGKVYYLTEQPNAIAGWRLDPDAGKWIFGNQSSRPLGSWKEE